MCIHACLVEAAVEVEIHGAPHDPDHVCTLRPARAEVVEDLCEEGLMFACEFWWGGRFGHHEYIGSNMRSLGVRRTSVTVIPAWAPPVREVCAEEEAASASRLLLEGKDGRTLTPAEAAAATAASRFSRSLCVKRVCVAAISKSTQ